MPILLRGGTLLLHDSNDHVIPTKSDLLIVGNKIAKIAPEIIPEEGTEVIECTDKIVSPGFIDTHRHLWQTPLKGRHANELLLGEIPFLKAYFSHLFFFLPPFLGCCLCVGHWSHS
jgi:cytosine/adenosine deaminase-related metal-dependent hydrolase